MEESIPQIEIKSIALKWREQIALATGAINHRKVAAGEFEQVAGDLLRACVRGRFVPCIRDIGQGSKSHGCAPCVMDEGRRAEDGRRGIVALRLS